MLKAAKSMQSRKRLPRAPVDPMPELAEFLAPFTVTFTQRPSARMLERYCTGLLTEHPNKNCDTLAQVVPGVSEQQLQHLVSDMAWDAVGLNRQRVRTMAALETEGDGVLIFDDTGFRKQGHASAGVQRQYSGTLGKTGNCQVAVTCHYAERTLGWPVDVRLYLPERWCADTPAAAMRRQRAHVPETVAFQTKPALALALLDEANALGVRHACITVDADYGDNPSFLNGLEARQERFIVAIRSDFTVARTRAGPPQPAATRLAAEPRGSWVTLVWTEGSRGAERAKFRALRGWRIDGDGTRHVGWLIGQRPARGQAGDRKYFWSNASARTPIPTLVEYAHRRHWIEQYYEEAKGELGWDKFQGRRYDAFHRNAVTVMLSYSFLIWLEWGERQQRRRRGPKRRPFSPSARSPSDERAARAPRRRRLAATSRGPNSHPPVTAPPQLPTATMTKQY
jgi:SRSO17 transposase